MRWRRAFRWIAIGLPSIALAGIAFVAWQGSSSALRPPWYQPRTPEQGLLPMSPDQSFFIWNGGYRDPMTDLGLAYEAFETPARDGSTLRGWVVPGAPHPRVGVVAVHGAGADRREFLRHVPIFHRAGLPVVLFDCREQGISDGRGRGISLGLRESEDTSTVAAWAKRELGLERVVVIGTSQGGASVILAAAADPGIDAVIAENPFTSIPDLVRDVAGIGNPTPGWAVFVVSRTAMWRMEGVSAWSRPSPIESVAAIAPRPLLLMHGTKDQAIPYQHSERLYAAAGEPRELWLLEGADHAQLFNAAPEEYERRVTAFLNRFVLAGLPARRTDHADGAHPLHER